MADRYANFSELARGERRDTDFRIRLRDRKSAVVIVAPHGGGIEPGTSELAEAIAGRDHSFYAFEGIKAAGNHDLHVSSTRFDEPACVDLVAAATTAVAIHGMEGEAAEVHVGGRAEEAAARVAAALTRRGFVVGTPTRPGLDGRDPANICNRGVGGRGVQLELSAGLRRALFASLSRDGRRITTPVFAQFVAAVREALG